MTMFSAPDALWLLALVPALVWLAWREAVHRRSRLAKLGDVELLVGLAEGASEGRRLRLRLLGVLAFALVVIGLAGPRFGEKTELLPRKGLDVVFAIDVSSSMRARDVRPDRLERTKAELSLLFDRLREHRLGIVAFAGTAFVQCPLTDDVEAARLFLSALDPSAVPQGGTDLGAGLVTAKNLFDAEAEASQKAREAGRLLVVVTDGEDHEGGVDEAAAALKQAGVHVIVLGVGSRMGEPIPVLDAAGGVLSYKKDRKGDTIMTRLSPSVLEEVARKTGGSFLEVMTRADFGSSDIEAAIGRLEKRELEARIKRTRVDRSAWPLGAAFLLLLALAALPERARPRARKRRTPFVAPLTIGLVSALSVVVLGATEVRAEGPFSRPEPHLEEGKRALERSAFDEAISRFRAAESEHPDERAIVEYDVGRALYEKGLAEKAASPSTGEPPAEGEAAPGVDLLRDAASAFERAYGTARDVDIRSQAALAEGNSFARAGDLERSVDAYRRSLVASPDNLRARQNLATVLRAIQQQEQQQQQQQKDEQQSGGGDEEKEQQPQTGDEQEQQEGDKKPDEQKDAQQKEQDEGKQQQDDEQEQKPEQQQPDDAAGDKKDEQQKQPPPPKEGSSDEERDPAGSAGKPKDEKKEEAKKLLDALRRRERPLNPLLMQPQRHIRNTPPEKDW